MINRAAELLGVGLLGGILLIVFANALSRYLLNYSFVWAEEVVISLVPWLAVTGLFLSVRRRQMIRIEYFLDRFPPASRALLASFGQLLGAVMLAWLAWLGFNYVSDLRRRPHALSRPARRACSPRRSGSAPPRWRSPSPAPPGASGAGGRRSDRTACSRRSPPCSCCAGC